MFFTLSSEALTFQKLSCAVRSSPSSGGCETFLIFNVHLTIVSSAGPQIKGPAGSVGFLQQAKQYVHIAENMNSNIYMYKLVWLIASAGSGFRLPPTNNRADTPRASSENQAVQ